MVEAFARAGSVAAAAALGSGFRSAMAALLFLLGALVAFGLPPRRTVRELLLAGEPALELLELRRVAFAATRARPEVPAAWRALWRRREIPAQPSTRTG